MGKARIPARVGRPVAPIVLTKFERKQLDVLSLESRSSRIAFRARLVLASANGQSGVEISRTQRVSVQTVAKWRARYLAEGVDGLRHRKSPRPKRRLDADLLARAAGMLEAGGMTTHEIARKLGISQTSVVRLKRGSRRAKFRRARRPRRVR